MVSIVLRQRYRIIKRLGAGGFGETYLAEDLDIPVTPKPKCVVKRLQPQVIHPEIQRLFQTEAETLYKLSQNNDQIPKLYAYFEENSQFYLVQEFIEGDTLRKEFIPGKRLSESYVIQLLKDVLSVLATVHQNNVIHRDIKPDNIMRCPDGKIVLIDFGAVKEISTLLVNQSGQTSRTIAIGTPGYMPSEQALGKPKFSSDLYALGMMAIQALTGIFPYQFPEDEHGEIVWHSFTYVNSELAKIISTMVRYDFRQRPKNASRVLQAIEEICNVSKPIKVGEKYGYINKEGRIFIDPVFDEANEYCEGIAQVGINKKYGFIDKKGNFLIHPSLDSCSHFSEGLAAFEIDGKWGYLDKTGNIVIPNKFDEALWFKEGLAGVRVGNQSAYISPQGEIIIPFGLYETFAFYEGLAWVKSDDKYGYIDHSGKTVIPFIFDSAARHCEGLAAVTMNNGGERGKSGFIDTTGNLVIPYQFDMSFGFSEGLCPVLIEEKWGYINPSGELIIPLQFDRAWRFSEGLAAVNIGEKWGFIDRLGKLVIPFKFQFAIPYPYLPGFRNGMALVEMDGKQRYIDKTGRFIY